MEIHCPQCRCVYTADDIEVQLNLVAAVSKVDDELSKSSKLKACCPNCHQWVELPTVNPIGPPDLDARMLSDLRSRFYVVAYALPETVPSNEQAEQAANSASPSADSHRHTQTIVIASVLGGIALVSLAILSVYMVISMLTTGAVVVSETVGPVLDAEARKNAGKWKAEYQGAHGVDRMLKDLRSQEFGLKSRATQWLAKTKVQPERKAEVALALDEFLYHNGRVQTDTVKALSIWATPESIPGLIAAAVDADSTDLDLIVATIGATGDPKAVPFLVRYLDNINAEKALLKSFDSTYVPQVAPCFNDVNEDKRGAARVVLQRWNAEEAIFDQCLVDLKSQSKQRFDLAFEYLGKINPDESGRQKIAEAVETVLRDRGEHASRNVFMACIEFGRDPETAIVLSELLRQNIDAGVEESRNYPILDALAEIGSSQVIPDVVDVFVRESGSVARFQKLFLNTTPRSLVVAELIPYNNDPDCGERVRRILQSFRTKFPNSVPVSDLLIQCAADLKNEPDRVPFAIKWLQYQNTDPIHLAMVADALNPILRNLQATDEEHMEACFAVAKKWGNNDTIPLIQHWVDQRDKLFPNERKRTPRIPGTEPIEVRIGDWAESAIKAINKR